MIGASVLDRGWGKHLASADEKIQVAPIYIRSSSDPATIGKFGGLSFDEFSYFQSLLPNLKKMKKLFLSFLIVFCIVTKVDAQDIQRTKKISGNLFNQMPDLPGELEAKSQVDIHFPDGELPAFKETELGHSEGSSSDNWDNGDQRRSRRVRELAGATINKDRIRWLLLISPLLVMLLSVAIYLFGARDPNKHSRGTKHGGDHRSNSQGRRNSRRRPLEGGYRPCSRQIENTSLTLRMAPLNIPQTENKHLVTGTSSRDSRSHYLLPSEHESIGAKRNEQSIEEGRRDPKMSSRGRNLEGNLESCSSPSNISRTVEDKHLVTRIHLRTSERNEVKFQDAGRDAGTCSVPDHTVKSDDQLYTSMDRGSCRKTFSTGDDASTGLCLEHEPIGAKRNEQSLEGKDGCCLSVKQQGNLSS
ncbi:uncharacterized protein [Eleutherodactylus coqui]|uniref:uncharacterized protein n=1 Tax=Eleutherodactylus coqui TaxID=57060 RepID=UPI0034617E9F